jgi:hypothetical protein
LIKAIEVAMSDELQKDEIARGVAQALAAEFGQDVVTETEKQLGAGTGGKRGFLPGWASDAAAVAGIILGAIELVRGMYSEWKTGKQMAELKAMLEERAPQPDRIDAATRSKILEKVVQSLPKPDGS